MKKHLVVLNICVCALILASTLSASPLLNSSGAGSTSISSLDAVVGYSFTIGITSLEASALGLFDQDLDGFSEAHNVNIWSSTGILLGSVTVPAGSLAPLQGEFRYVSLLAPVTLVSGETYVIAANYPSQVDWFIANPLAQANAIFSPFASFGVSASRLGPGFPLWGAQILHAGPNIEFTPVPEPSLLMLTASEILVILAFQIVRLNNQCTTANR
ncbi:MAG: hypothetical protein WDM76_09750 [Limisphaerales bacterium]